MLFWAFLADSFHTVEKSLLNSSSSILDRLNSLICEAQSLRNKKSKKEKTREVEVKISMRRSQDDGMSKFVGRLSGDHERFSGNCVPDYYFQISK